MIVFKAFLKILNKCKAPIIMYTVFLVFFGGFNLKTNDTSSNFVASTPDVIIINKDEKKGVTKNLIEYLEKNSNIVKVKEDKIDDALFYRDASYVIYIPNNFRESLLNNKSPKIKIKSAEDYESSMAEMMLKRYMSVATTYSKISSDEEEFINYINSSLKNKTKIKVNSKLDIDSLEKVSFYYNFTNYCLLAGSIYVICLILSSFKNKNIDKRIIVSSINYKKYNMKLLLSNSLFAITLWAFYVLLSFILIGDIMFSMHGLFYIINSFIFTLCALSIAFLLGNVVSNKNAVNGIVNVIALGSSFLCGAFVPMDFLPDFVLKIAHILPSYYFIKNNELLKKIEIMNFNNLKPILLNMIILILFIILFIVLTNIISKKKQKSMEI